LKRTRNLYFTTINWILYSVYKLALVL